MPHNPASIVRLLYGARTAEENHAEAFSLNPATNSLTSAVPIGQGHRSRMLRMLSMLRSRSPDLVVDLLLLEIVAHRLLLFDDKPSGTLVLYFPQARFL
jgi:hypothetical protein